MKRFYYLIGLIIIGFCVLSSCKKDTLDYTVKQEDILHNKNLEEISDLIITSLTIKPQTSARSAQINPIDMVEFQDSISGQNYSYFITSLERDKFLISFKNMKDDENILLDMNLLDKEECLIKSTYKGNKINLKIKSIELLNGSVLYTLNTVENGTIDLRGRDYESWGDCVTRIATNGEVAVGSGIASSLFKRAYLYVAGAAAIVCLDKRNRIYEDTSINPEFEQG